MNYNADLPIKYRDLEFIKYEEKEKISNFYDQWRASAPHIGNQLSIRKQSHPIRRRKNYFTNYAGFTLILKAKLSLKFTMSDIQFP